MNKIKTEIKSLFTLLVLTFFTATMVFAQETSTTTTTSTERTTEFKVEPWMWVVGAAVFILILVAILKGGNKNKS